MKRVAFLCLLASGAAMAQTDTYLDNARVRSVEPQYQTVQVPRNECRSEWVSEARPVAAGPNYGGVVIGGIAGGLIGNQVGKGHGREAATAVGAVVGAMAGNHIAGQRTPQYQEAQREVRNCRQVVDMQTRVEGYRVTYEYRGREYMSVMRDDPGPVVPVRVSVTPVPH